MRLTGSRVYYRPTPPKMPTGLVQLMEGLTREVLKNNPTDVHGFCATHMQQLLEKRDGPLRKKSLTLEEKIARAQEKVRERAEKRRQQYDNELLLRQHSGNAPEINKGDPSLHSQELDPVTTLKTQINQEDVSSEVEISHEHNTESHTSNEDSKNEHIDKEAIKNNDILEIDANNEARTESKNKSDIIDPDQISDHRIIAQDVPVNEVPQTESSISKEDLLDNEHATENKNLNNLFESQPSDGENNSHKENTELESEASRDQKFDEVIQDSILDVSTKNINISTQAETESTDDNLNKDTSIIPDEQNSLTQTGTVTSIDAAELQIDRVREPKNIEESQQSNDTKYTQKSIDLEDIKPLSDSDHVELSTNNGNKEDNTIESKTIDLSYRESPSIELQDPVIDSDMLESLPATETDCDIATLITQDSMNDELMLNKALKNDISHVTESITTAKMPEVVKESKMTVSDTEEVDKNTHLQNQIDSIDATEKPMIVADTENINENNHINNHGEDTSKQSENPQNSNQDSNMNLETAAITIQKVFRTFLFKSRASTFDDTVNEETIFLDEDNKNKEECDFPIAGALNTERRPHGITRMDTVLQTVNEEKSLSLSTDDSSLSSAATVIQAHVRGFLVRNKLNSNKTVSTNSLAASNSNEPSLTSLEIDTDQNKNKTILNIHIVPEGGNYLSRDESLITSMDLSLDSPPSSINLQLHPLGYDKSERRKLKREDAIQSISPPSNNSGKLSEDVDSVKELPLNDHVGIADHQERNNSTQESSLENTSIEDLNFSHVENIVLKTIVSKVPGDTKQDTDNSEINIKQKRKSLTKMNSDEMDVVTAFISNEEHISSDSKLMHTGEFHDAVLPTKVSRSNTSVASEFKNVLVYFLLWNNS